MVAEGGRRVEKLGPGQLKQGESSARYPWPWQWLQRLVVAALDLTGDGTFMGSEGEGGGVRIWDSSMVLVLVFAAVGMEDVEMAVASPLDDGCSQVGGVVGRGDTAFMAARKRARSFRLGGAIARGS